MSNRFFEAYTYVFYCLRQFAQAISNDSFQDWKALIFICVFQVALIYGTAISIENFLDQPLLFFDSVLLQAGPLSIILVLLNYWLLMHKDRWRQYESRFQAYSKLKRRLGQLSVVIGLSAAATLLIVALARIEPIARPG